MITGFIYLIWRDVRSERIRHEEARKRITCAAEGVLDRVSYGYDEYIHETRSGSMVHSTSRHLVRYDVTAVFFDDGRTYIAERKVSNPFPKGTRIRVMVNGLGKTWLEEAK